IRRRCVVPSVHAIHWHLAIHPGALPPAVSGPMQTEPLRTKAHSIFVFGLHRSDDPRVGILCGLKIESNVLCVIKCVLCGCR
ncbi:hypothetical protein PENTCL1PPCAC_14174, partial [Pristionchus entomophagus]